MPATATEEEERCRSCGEEINEYNPRAVEDDCCRMCSHECVICNEWFHDDDITLISWNYYCDGCSEECENCGDRVRETWLVDRLAVGACCRDTCYDCGTYILINGYDESDRCENCYYNNDSSYGGRNGIEPYGHTTPSLWLRLPGQSRRGNPDANGNNERYYIGFEHEIYSDSGEDSDATPVKDWAEEHLGDRTALVCKEDSSVHGFEIVSQPMTPEFFESIDWDSYMAMLNDNYPLGRRGDEPEDHGIHVHIGRVAFNRDDLCVAAYSYLLGQGTHLERIGKRQATGYCPKVKKPVSAAIIASGKESRQRRRLQQQGIYPGRDAINLTNGATIEIRAFKSTRNADDLRAAVRLVYISAEYIRHLRSTKLGMGGRALHWTEFAKWTASNYPDAFASIAGLETPKK